MLRVLSPEECLDSRRKMLDEMHAALFELEDNGYPKNTELFNTLLQIMKLWEAGCRLG